LLALGGEFIHRPLAGLLLGIEAPHLVGQRITLTPEADHVALDRFSLSRNLLELKVPLL
jgi:hypothetical protein